MATAAEWKAWYKLNQGREGHMMYDLNGKEVKGSYVLSPRSYVTIYDDSVTITTQGSGFSDVDKVCKLSMDEYRMLSSSILVHTLMKV